MWKYVLNAMLCCYSMGGHESTAVNTPAQGPPLAPPQNVNGTK